MTVMLILVSSILTPIFLKLLFASHREPHDDEPSKYRGHEIEVRPPESEDGAQSDQPHSSEVNENGHS